jgi:hypothetical protein
MIGVSQSCNSAMQVTFHVISTRASLPMAHHHMHEFSTMNAPVSIS